jgi:hypothetical protein
MIKRSTQSVRQRNESRVLDWNAEEDQARKEAQGQAMYRRRKGSGRLKLLKKSKALQKKAEDVEALKKAQELAMKERGRIKKANQRRESSRLWRRLKIASEEEKKKELEMKVQAAQGKSSKNAGRKEAARIAAEEEVEKGRRGGSGCKKASAEHGTQFYSLEELAAGVEGVEYATREQYLSPAEFLSYFGMNKEEFSASKPWKKMPQERMLAFGRIMLRVGWDQLW